MNHNKDNRANYMPQKQIQWFLTMSHILTSKRMNRTQEAAINRAKKGFRHDNSHYKMGEVELHPCYDTEVVANPQIKNYNMIIVWGNAASPRKEKKNSAGPQHIQYRKELRKTLGQLNSLNQYSALDTQRVKEIKSRDTRYFAFQSGGRNVNTASKPNLTYWLNPTAS